MLKDNLPSKFNLVTDPEEIEIAKNYCKDSVKRYFDYGEIISFTKDLGKFYQINNKDNYQISYKQIANIFFNNKGETKFGCEFKLLEDPFIINASMVKKDLLWKTISGKKFRVLYSDDFKYRLSTYAYENRGLYVDDIANEAVSIIKENGPDKCKYIVFGLYYSFVEIDDNSCITKPGNIKNIEGPANNNSSNTDISSEITKNSNQNNYTINSSAPKYSYHKNEEKCDKDHKDSNGFVWGMFAAFPFIVLGSEGKMPFLLIAGIALWIFVYLKKSNRL